MLNPIYRLQLWMETRGGQKFMNYAYSWGAAVVILGTLFKLTHIPGANLMLFVGMGTEVFVFFVAGFDMSGIKARDPKRQAAIDAEEAGIAVTPGVPAGGVVIVNGGGNGPAQPASGDAQAGGSVLDGATLATGGIMPAGGVVGGGVIGGAQLSSDAVVAQRTLNSQLSTLNSQLSTADELAQANSDYVEQLNSLTETLKKVSEQAQRMSTDSAEMENLNRTLTGINTIYEMQLKSISTQVGTIDNINDQTRRLARQIEELNAIYARMIEAMTTNMGMRG